MHRLIDANDARKRSTHDIITHFLDRCPTVEAVEVVHGRWMRKEYRGQNDRKTWEWFCSECKTLGSPQWKCCPVCTAKMDGGNEDA